MLACVLDEAAVFKSRWPMMSLEKILKRATRKNIFMAPCVMFPYTGLEMGRKKNGKTFLLPTALPICQLWTAQKGRTGGRKGIRCAKRKKKKPEGTKTNPLSFILPLHLGTGYLPHRGGAKYVTPLLHCLGSVFLP